MENEKSEPYSRNKANPQIQEKLLLLGYHISFLYFNTPYSQQRCILNLNLGSIERTPTTLIYDIYHIFKHKIYNYRRK